MIPSSFTMARRMHIRGRVQTTLMAATCLLEQWWSSCELNY